MQTQLSQEAVGGSSDTIVAAEPTIEDRFAAFGNEQAEEEKKPDDPLDDAPAPDDIDPELLTSEAEAEVAAEPPIAPPVSWTAEEKAEFADLPRALQETLTRRETEREKFVQTKAQEAKAIQQKVERTAAERIAQAQDANLQTLAALLPEIPEKPAHKYRTQNPAAWDEAMDAYESAVAQHRYVQQVAQKVHTERQAAETAAARDEAAQNEAVLREKLPEYFGEKGPELERELRSTAQFLGYTEEQLAHVDANDVLAMKKVSELKAKADKYDTLMARQMQSVRDAKILPKVSRPGVPLGKGAIAGERYQADRQAMRAGDREAGIRLFSGL